MTIKIVTPADWNMVPPTTRSHYHMDINDETPYLRLLLCEPHSYTQPHSHSEPEVMIVLKGRMMLNGKWCEQGSVAYISANEDYWHSTGAEECVVALMRPNTNGKIRRAVEAVAPAT